MWWTILAVVVAVILFVFIAGGPTFAGRKSLGDVQETRARLWSGLWKKDDADRLR